jgi:hypothetical protein
MATTIKQFQRHAIGMYGQVVASLDIGAEPGLRIVMQSKAVTPQLPSPKYHRALVIRPTNMKAPVTPYHQQ